MKKKITAIIFCVLCFKSFAQITVTETDLLDIGDVIYQAYDSMPDPTITIGNSGANQTWDFSSLQATESLVLNVVSPAGTPYASNHPSANICIEDDGEYIYIQKSATSVNLVGIDDLPYPQILLPLPLTYNSSNSIGPVTIMDSSIYNMFIPDSLAVLITFGQYQFIDSIGIEITSISNFNVDGYGNVTVPMGTYEALRVHAEDVSTTNYFVHCTDSSGSSGAWYSMPQFIFPSEVNTTSMYQWWSNDPVVKFVLVQAYVDSVGNIEEVDFLEQGGVNTLSNFDSDLFEIFPIPLSHNLTVDYLHNDLVDGLVYDINGKKVFSFSFTNTTNINLSNLESGVYFIHLESDQSKLIKKLIIE